MAQKIDSTSSTRGSCMQSHWQRSGSPVDNAAGVKSLKKALCDVGLEALISFPVVHCPHAFRIVLKAVERTNSIGKVIPGWKIVYSGDPRPCLGLVEASHSATLLIHEANREIVSKLASGFIMLASDSGCVRVWPVVGGAVRSS
ncbi:Metallo-beta-lactamase [Parasponia andersonii]|uniref:ribonuclease Z n=1 Tax=Parasponia andersonii TaxID=3476 RepID=A0A2P5BAS3_PARAD|nr:Metallo-beta-lactamase [Parasponia andersonii]